MSGRTPPGTAGRFRRGYDNSRRRQQADQTRERIVRAGAELARRSLRDWKDVTVKAIAEQAGVSERTVFRHFANERALREAVMLHLRQQAGVDLSNLDLHGVVGAAGRILDFVGTHGRGDRPPLDPTLASARQDQHEALMRAVAEQRPAWSEDQRRGVAGVLDVCWAVGSYERLVEDWGMGHGEAVAALQWAVRALISALETGAAPEERPTSG